MRITFPLFFILVFFSESAIFAKKKDPHDLKFHRLAASWDEAIPLGNGMLGALIWEKGNHLRFSLDRADLWDLRPMENFTKPEFSFQWIQKQVSDNNYKAVQSLFDEPYDQLAAPSKIPGAALEFSIKELGEVAQVNLCLKNATCEIKWKNGTSFKTFVHASQPAGWFRFENVPKDFTPVLIPPEYQKNNLTDSGNIIDGQDLQRLGYEQGKVSIEGHKIVYRQKGWNGFEYEAAVEWKRSGKVLTGVWSVTSSFQKDQKADQIVSEHIKQQTFRTALLTHQDWWRDYWKKSSIRLPDSVLEKQWFLEQYKFGCVARSDAPPISLQAIWTADNGKLPPWKGDFHHDLNTELSYWPSYSANHLDLEEGFLNWLWKNRELFKKYTRTYFGTSGLNVPGVTTLTGEPLGGWIQYSLGPTVGCWLAQHFYLHWIYSKDEKFLRDRAYPWISDVSLYLSEISIMDQNGKRKLPLSSSPEINDNNRNAWFGQTTNFDLGFIRWTYEKAAELAEHLGRKSEAQKWSSLLQEWPDFALDQAGGLSVAPGYPYSESHRHFSHLVSWHPLGVIDWSKGKRDQEIIRSTLHNLEEKGPDWWCGYSYSWLGNLYARAHQGNKAEGALKIFAENFCLPNSFHVNGEQYDRGFSKMKYRPFTLEGNFAFAAGIQEMLIQSHTGTIEIFPAIPDAWKNVSFSTLRAAGAFLVSAEQKMGKIERVEIISEKGGSCKLLNPFGTSSYHIKCNWKNPQLIGGDSITIQFPINGKIIFLKS